VAERGTCRCCGNEYSINANGTVRYHIAADAECQDPEDASSRKCRGAGQPPKGTETETAEPQAEAGYVCRECKHPVQLTLNGRARSHLNPRTNPPERCGGGSDWPLWHNGRGEYRDTAPKGEVRPAAAPEDLRFGDDEDPVADFLGTGRPDPVTVVERLLSPGYDPQDPDGPGEPPTEDNHACHHGVFRSHDECPEHRTPDPATWIKSTSLNDDQFAAAAAGDGRTAAQQAEIDRRMDDPVGSVLIGLMGAEVGQPGTVLDALGFDPQDPDGPGEAADCRLPECCTHPQGFRYADDDNGHSGVFCPLCGAPPPEPCTHPEHVYAGTDENGEDVWACDTCGGIEDRSVSRMLAGPRAKAIVGQLDVGLFFRRHTKDAPLDRLVYRVNAVGPDWVDAVVVSAGPYGGRTGKLTNLTEEITCTDLDGKPRPRRTTSQPSSPSRAPRPTATGTVPSSPPPTPASAPIATERSPKETSSGPTETAGTSTRSAPMTTPEAKEAGAFLMAGSGSYGEQEARYGRWGRYKLQHPHTGRTVEWTRATTFAKSISDTFTLAQWGKRNVLLGATLRPDLVALAHGKDITKDREALNTWCEELEKAAGSKVAANLGTAVHSFTEMVDRNWADRWRVLREEIPEDFRPHVEAYILLLEEYGLEPVPHMIEFSTGVLQYEVMGTSDNCYRATKHLALQMPRGEVRLSPGEHVIGDKKTGKDLDYGWQEITIQLALYAQGVNTLGVFDWDDRTWDPDPLSRFAEPGTKVREDVGIILHLPVDPRSTKKPGLHGVDLESGWNAAVLCERVRAWRKLRTLAGPVAVVDVNPLSDEDPAANLPPMHKPAPSAADQAPLSAIRGTTQAAETLRATVRPPTLRERAEAVTSKAEASAVYQDAVAAGVSVAEAKELIALMQERIKMVAEPGGAKV
jgi:hypothetical protein